MLTSQNKIKKGKAADANLSFGAVSIGIDRATKQTKEARAGDADGSEPLRPTPTKKGSREADALSIAFPLDQRRVASFPPGTTQKQLTKNSRRRCTIDGSSVPSIQTLLKGKNANLVFGWCINRSHTKGTKKNLRAYGSFWSRAKRQKTKTKERQHCGSFVRCFFRLKLGKNNVK